MADKPKPGTRVEPNWSEFPVQATMRFRTEEERERFFSGLSDGWGEQWCDFEYPYTMPEPGKGLGVPFGGAYDFAVTYVWDRDADDDE